ncbi:hypothetical protein AB0E83_07855 [Streptomyces sp. NPDC035033]|uniref:hypothetical protein n=1 Tax=Streptomyces sp. NPDC035033 TaxID=3155368 RepID=UPI0033D177F6
MSASEKSDRNPFRLIDPYAVPDPAAWEDEEDPDMAEAYDPAVTGEPRLLPAPFAEKARTATRVARGAGEALWTTVRAHPAVAGGAAAGAAVVVTAAYTLGRRAGHRAGRRARVPVVRLLAHRP